MTTPPLYCFRASHKASIDSISRLLVGSSVRFERIRRQGKDNDKDNERMNEYNKNVNDEGETSRRGEGRGRGESEVILY